MELARRVSLHLERHTHRVIEQQAIDSMRDAAQSYVYQQP